MKQAKIPFQMIGLLMGLLLLVGTVALAGCQAADSDFAEDGEQIANVEPVLVETATAVAPTEEPNAEPIEEPAPVDNCLDCHTNKDLLIQTADPEEEVINENEGEG